MSFPRAFLSTYIENNQKKSGTIDTQISLKSLLVTSVHGRVSKSERTPTGERGERKVGGGGKERGGRGRKTVCNIACHAKWGEATVRLNTVFKHLQYFIICISRRQVTN